MASRNRVIYQSEALYCSFNAASTTSGDHVQLQRVQSANYGFNLSRTDVNQYGELARIGTEVIDAPTVSLDFTYYPTDGFNEKALNFYVITGKNNAGSASTANMSGSFTSGHQTATSGSNFFILTVNEGQDAADKKTGTFLGLGNMYVSDYTFDCSVGSIPTVSVTCEGSNVISDVNVDSVATGGYMSIDSPGVNQEEGTSYDALCQVPYAQSGAPSAADRKVTDAQTLALRPGDITLELQGAQESTNIALGGATGAHIQSASLSVPLSRTPLDRLRSRFACARTVDFPIVASLSVSALVNDENAFVLADIIDKNLEKDVTLQINRADDTNAYEFLLKNCTMDSQNTSSSIGANKSVDLTFTTQIGGVADTDHGIFCTVYTGVLSGNQPIYPLAVNTYDTDAGGMD